MHGDEDFSNDSNSNTVESALRFIHETGRFADKDLSRLKLCTKQPLCPLT